MMLLPLARKRFLLPVPDAQWKQPSQRSSAYGIENETKFRLTARLHDGHILWRGWFSDRHEADAFLVALAHGTLQQETPLWRLPNPAWPNLDPDVVYDFVTVSFLTSTGTNNWSVPADWNNASNTIECVGGGGSGANAGGGGGAYSLVSNQTYTPSASRSYTVGSTAGDTSIKQDDNSTTACLAKGGASASGRTNGNGGASGSGTGSTKYSGGNGGSISGGDNGGSGGGGAAGPSGAGWNGAGWSGPIDTDQGRGGGGAGGGSGSAGKNSGSSTSDATSPGGNGGNGPSGSGGGSGTSSGAGNAGSAGGGGGGSAKSQNALGGAGGAGTDWDASHGAGGGGGGAGSTSTGGQGGLYGGGGGGGLSGGGSGRQGIITISYTAASNLYPANNSPMLGM